MTKPKSAVKRAKTQGDRHDVIAQGHNPVKSTQPSNPPPPRRTDAVLRSATALEVRVSRALDQELEWWFAYAEAALHRDDVGILPSYAAVRILATEPTDEACRIRGHELARAVQGCLCRLPGRHASVLRAAYTPRRWPRSVENAFDILAPIAVRLAFANDPWPARLSAHTGLEEAVAVRLSAALRDPAKVKVAKIRNRAQRLLGHAVAAYAKARALEGVALGVS
jgi:hypothetical protein